MFESIRGILLSKDPQKAVVETHGIGYRLMIPFNTYSRLAHIGEEVFLYLTQIIREDAHTLFAFLEREERDLFEMIITVSGIGPKTGLAIVGHLDLNAFHSAITTSDTRLLHKIPGIGKKTAERLILEMKDKLKTVQKKNFDLPLLSSSDQMLNDAISTLMNLGYESFKAQKAVQKARSEDPEEKDLGKFLTLVLKLL